MSSAPHRPDTAIIGYAALLVPNEIRKQLSAIVRPRYPDIKGDHITLRVGVISPSAEMEKLATMFRGTTVEVIGVADDNYAVQCFLVNVNGTRQDETDRPYHITWSIDSTKLVLPEYNLSGESEAIGSKHAKYVAGREAFGTIWPQEKVLKFKSDCHFLQSPNITRSVLAQEMKAGL